MGQESHLYLPDEAAARAAGEELVGLGHLLVAVGPCDTATAERLGLPEGWWGVRSLAANVGETAEAVRWVTHQATIGIDRVARDHGGFASGSRYAHLDHAIRSFSYDGLVHDRAGHIGNPVGVRPQAPTPPAAPLTLGNGGAVDALINVFKAVAVRVYGDVADMPEHAGWLFDDEDYYEPFDDVREFMDLWVEAVSSDGQGSDVTADAAAYVAALAADDAVAPAVRGSLLLMLLGTAAEQHRHQVGHTGACDVLGGGGHHHAADVSPVYVAIAAEVPRLLERWDTETDAARLLLAALATLVPDLARPRLEHRLGDIPAPPGTRRADVVALIHGLLHGEAEHALQGVAAWHGGTAVLTAHGADPRTTAIAALAELVDAELVMTDPHD